MTKFKRLVAAMLAILMVLTSVSVMAFADSATDGTGTKLTLATKIFRQVGSEWKETTQVIPGETVKARVYVGTNYYTSSGQLLFFYNTDFFEDASAEGLHTLAVNDAYSVKGITGEYYSSESETPVIATLTRKGIIDEIADVNSNLSADKLAFYNITYTFPNDPATGKVINNQLLKADEWLCEFDLTVKADADITASAGDFFAIPGSAKSPSYQRGYIDVPKGSYEGLASSVANMNTWTATLDMAEMAEVTLYTDYVEAIFNAGEGAEFADGSAQKVYTGNAGEPLTPAEPEKDGYNFLGWVEVGAQDLTPVSVTAFPTATKSYDAAWEAKSVSDYTLGFRTEIWRMNDAGEWEYTDRVIPGEDVKMRVFVDTDYYTPNGNIIVFYENDFFTDSYDDNVQQAATLNTSGSAVTEGVSAATITALSRDHRILVGSKYTDPLIPDYISEEFADTHNAFVVKFEFSDGKSHKLSSDEWLFEIDLQVLESARGCGKGVIEENTIQNTARQHAYINLPVAVDAGETTVTATPLYAIDINYDIENKKACTWTQVTFDADGGTFVETTTDIYTIEGHITDPIPADKLPADPTKATYTFEGWVPEGMEMKEENALTADEVLAQYPEFTFDELVFTALWTKNVTISFADTGDTVIDPIVDVTPGDEFAEVADPVKDGYTFRGWDVEEGELPDVYPEEDTTYTAIWAKDVTVYFETESATDIDPVDGYAGQEFPADEIPDPEKEGHYFVGWATNDPNNLGEGETLNITELPTVFPGEDTTYYAVFEAKTYQVIYWVLDPVSMEFDKVSVNPVIYGNKINPTPPGYVAPEGYTLSAAYMDISFKTPLEEGATMPANEVNLYYKLTAEKYDVTFDPNGGTWADGTTDLIVRADQVYDTEIVEPFAPTKEGHKFLGWDKPVTNVPAEDITFTAIWETLTYDATYVIEGEEIIFGEETEVFPEILYGEPIEVPADPEVVGKTFVKWVDAEGKTPDDYVTMPAKDVVFTAVFENNVYDLTYELDGGNVDGDESDIVYNDVPYGGEVPVPENEPVKEGHKFTGWDDLSTETATDIPATMPAGDTVITATWEKLNYSVTYIIEGEEIIVGSEEEVFAEVPYGDVIPVPATPEVVGKTFDKWVDAEGNTLAAYTEGMPAENLEFTATFIPNTYDVTIDPNGGTWEDDTTDPIVRDDVPYESDIEMPKEPTKEGHEFAGWDNPATETPTDAPTTVPAGDVTITATWNKLSYTATYVVEGEEKASYEIPYADDVTVPAETPVKPGYTFVKWVENTDKKEPAEYTDGMPAKALTFTAEFDVNKHDVTFKLDGGNIGGDTSDVVKEDVPFGSSIIAPTQPAKEGYNFLGWTSDGGKTILSADELGTMPDSDVEFTAFWEANPDREYVVEFYKQDPNTGEYPTDPYQSLKFNNGVSDKVITYEVTTVPTGFVLDLAKSELSGKIPANPNEILVLKVYYSRDQYELDVYVDGAQTVDKTYNFEQKVEKVDDPTKEGYTFAGWVDNATPETALDSAERVDIPAKMPAEDIAVKATWTINEYNAKFDANTGAFPEDAPADYAGDETVTFPVEFEQPITVPVAPEKEGYDFVGWDDVSTPDVNEAEDPNYVIGNIGAGDKEFVAVWEKSASTLKFFDYIDSEKGPGDEASAVYTELTQYTKEVIYDEAIEFPETLPSKQWDKYYEFKGWADAEGNMVATVDEDGNLVTTATMPADDYNLYAVYERHVVKLVPTNEDSTAVIERDGITESYNEGFGEVHYRYPYNSYEELEGYEEWYVYGLNIKVTGDELADYVTVYGDGYYEIEYTEISHGYFCGTGAEIFVYDNVTGDLVEKFYIVIFGDVNGDAQVDAGDTSLINSEIQIGATWSNPNSADYHAYLYKAANVAAEDSFNALDNNLVTNHVTGNGNFEIDQVYGVPQA